MSKKSVLLVDDNAISHERLGETVPNSDYRDGQIEDRIEAADSALGARLHEFSVNHSGTPEENQRINDALSGLTVLRRESWHGNRSQRPEPVLVNCRERSGYRTSDSIQILQLHPDFGTPPPG